MHDSDELAAPPSDDPAGRGGRRRTVIAVALALLVMVFATLAMATSRSPEAQAQDDVATLTGTCSATDDTMAVFAFTFHNAEAAEFFFYYRLTPFGTPDQEGDFVVTGEATVAAGQDFSLTFDAMAHGDNPTWNVYVLDSGGSTVGASNTLANPCLDTETTSTTTTTTTTTTSTTTTTTTDATTTTTDTTDTTDTPTDDFTLPGDDVVTTTTDDPGAVTNTSGGGGLAQTGVAIAVFVGAAGVLLFNGIGLMRMTRRGWATENDD